MLRQPRYSMDEHVRRGEEIYERQVRSQVERENRGKIVAIDIDSGEYEISDNVLSASQLLLARLPDAQIWCIRIGTQQCIDLVLAWKRRGHDFRDRK